MTWSSVTGVVAMATVWRAPPESHRATSSLPVVGGVFDDAGDDVVVRLLEGTGVERRLRVVLDHQLRRFGSGAVEQQLHQTQRHVDPTRHAGGGDDALVEVLDHAVRHRRCAVLGQDVAGTPVCRRREAVEQPGGGEHERAGAHRRREPVVVGGRHGASRAPGSSAINARGP